MLTGHWLLMFQMSIVPSSSEFSSPRMTLKMNASCSSAFSVAINQFTPHNFPEDLNLPIIGQFLLCPVEIIFQYVRHKCTWYFNFKLDRNIFLCWKGHDRFNFTIFGVRRTNG